MLKKLGRLTILVGLCVTVTTCWLIGAVADPQAVMLQLCRQQQRVLELQARVAQAQTAIAAQLKPETAPPLLSFVMPCYNRATVLDDVISSIYNQNLTVPFEVVAIDDASTDNSFTILQSYAAKLPNFYAYRNATNQRAPATRNIAIAYARGKYICNADSDDVFEPNSIQPMLDAMITGNYDVAFFQELRFFNDRTLKATSISASTPPQNIITLENLLRENYISPCAGNRIFTKDSWLHAGGYLEDRGHDSWSFSFKLLASGCKAYVHPKSGYLHRLWSNKTSMWWDDNVNKVNNISPLRVVCENPEFFTPESFAKIANYKKAEPDLMSFIQQQLANGGIKLIPQQQLEPLLKAYYYENRQEYQKAVKHYNLAVRNGLTHQNALARAAWANAQLKNANVMSK
ncbi:MAG TPA: glycosyltransferase family 2 protein [Candidatus Babeliales bacterium]|nr:MAG: hypothetical protein A3F67_01035 [Verrucomicrobia bacterium RIFCSPHIGHO2_12_FULL_41_10]HLB41190.1 glycosyltransferase family 2 protein [Candidatus Babeliales bacterium]